MNSKETNTKTHYNQTSKTKTAKDNSCRRTQKEIKKEFKCFTTKNQLFTIKNRTAGNEGPKSSRAYRKQIAMTKGIPSSVIKGKWTKLSSHKTEWNSAFMIKIFNKLSIRGYTTT